jgi:NADH:ubiquinone oxidoreductase subunit 6 (subunit J)
MTSSILPSIENLSDFSLYTFLQIDMLGQTLYTYNFILLIIMGLILFLAMFGPIVLSLK